MLLWLKNSTAASQKGQQWVLSKLPLTSAMNIGQLVLAVDNQGQWAVHNRQQTIGNRQWALGNG